MIAAGCMPVCITIRAAPCIAVRRLAAARTSESSTYFELLVRAPQTSEVPSSLLHLPSPRAPNTRTPVPIRTLLSRHQSATGEISCLFWRSEEGTYLLVEEAALAERREESEKDSAVRMRLGIRRLKRRQNRHALPDLLPIRSLPVLPSGRNAPW